MKMKFTKTLTLEDEFVKKFGFHPRMDNSDSVETYAPEYVRWLEDRVKSGKEKTDTFEADFYLEKSSLGNLELVAKDHRLNKYYVLAILNDGTLLRHYGLRQSLGLQLDDQGKIKEC